VKLMVLYGCGYVAIFGIFFLLYLHVWRRRRELGLTPFEAFDTYSRLQEQAGYVSVGLVSIAIAVLGGSRLAFFSGISYGLLGPVMGFLGARRGKARRALEA
jgi:hypothetical protein